MDSFFNIERNIELPAGWTTQVLPNNNYTDDQITYLYQLFNCCMSDLVSQKVTGAIKGMPVDLDCMAKLKLMTMGINLLRTWYNPATWYNGQFTFTIPLGTYLGTEYVSLYYVTSNSSFDTSIPILVNASGNNYAAMVASILSLLPPGYTMAVIGASITIYLPFSKTPYLPWMFGIINDAPQWSSTNMQTYNYQNCISLSAVQAIVEQIFKICGCVNCKNTQQVEKDNYYISLGLKNNAPVIQINIQNP